MKQIIYKFLFMSCFTLWLGIVNSQEAVNPTAWYEPQLISTFKEDGTAVDKTTLIYDSVGNLTAEIRESFMNDAWMQAYKRSSTYDKSKNKLTLLMETQNQGKLVNNSLTTYTYDKDGNILTEVSQRWLNDTWLNNQRTVWTYDEQGNNLVKQQGMWKDEQWENTNGITFTYDGSGNILTETADFKGVGQSRLTRTYDDKRNKLTEIRESWDAKTTAWANSSRTIWAYNAQDQELSYLYENWKVEAWTSSQRRTNTYDATGKNRLVQLNENWKVDAWVGTNKYTWTYVDAKYIQSYLNELYENNNFRNYERTQYTYDKNGMMLTNLKERFNNSKWNADNRNTWTYDAKENLLTHLIERYYQEKWTITDDFSWTYDTNENSALFEKVGSTANYFHYNNMQSKHISNSGGYKTMTVSYIDVNAKVLIPVTGISLNKTNLELEVGDTISLQAIVTPNDASNQKISWASSNGHVRVNDKGLLTAISGGTALITVTTLDGGFTATCEVSVKLIAVEKIALNVTSLDIKVDKTYSFSTTITPQNATNQSLKWKSSKENVAMISGAGLLTAISTGETVITVTTDDGGHTAICNVKVSEPVTNVSLNKVSVEMKVGDTFKLIANVSPSNATNKTVLWTSSDSSILSVQGGLVTAMAAGNAIITATSEDIASLSAACSFKIGTVSIEDLNSKYVNVLFAKDYISIDANVRILKVCAYDLRGRLVYEGNNGNPIYTQNWVDGMYIIKIAGADNVLETKKIIVK